MGHIAWACPKPKKLRNPNYSKPQALRITNGLSPQIAQRTQVLEMYRSGYDMANKTATAEPKPQTI